ALTPGSTPTTIGTSDDRIALMGAAVVVWTGAARVAPLTVWTAANGVKVLGMTSNAFATTVAVSPDGSRMLYFDGVDPPPARTSGTLFIANTDGTGQKELATSVALNTPGCAPVVAFGGNTAAAAAFCIAVPTPEGGAPDGGTSDGGTSDGATSDVGTSDVGTLDIASPDGGTSDG